MVPNPASGLVPNPASGLVPAVAPVISKLLSIEMARGIAAIIVVLYHAARHLDKNVGFALGKQIFQFGHAGVDFFFVISGFIILYVHGDDLGRPQHLGRYVSRRFTRIYPIYWVVLAVIAVQALLSARLPVPALLDVAWAATLLPIRAEPLVGVAWTLQHEIIFYAVFAVLIIHLRVGLIVLGLWLVFIVLAQGGASFGPAAILVSAYNLEFFMGMAAAYWLRHGITAYPCAALLLGAAAFLCFAAADDCGLFDGYGAPARLAYGLSSALIVVGLAGGERSGRFQAASAAPWLGRASYSIYLFHLSFIGLADKLWNRAGLGDWVWAEYGFIAAAGIGGGIAVSRLVEYPLMRLFRRVPAYFSRS